jgi:hypothetical protein
MTMEISMRVIAILLSVTLAGCTTVTLNGAETKSTKVDYPPVGEVVTAFVGDHLVQKGEVVEEKVLQVNSLIDGALYDIPQGTYPQVGYNERDNFFSANGVVDSALADPHKVLQLAKKEGAELCVVSVYNSPYCYKGSYDIKAKISERGTSFQQTLIYSGRVGNKINVGYREFSNSLARPAFNNDVEYDLSTSNIIGYKGAQIEVLDADNSSIRYRLIKNFP